jgi:hypothetical protein
LALTTLFIQEMLDRGFLASAQFSATYGHQPRHVESYLRAVNEVFPILTDAIARDTVEQRLRGPVKHCGFQRLT